MKAAGIAMLILGLIGTIYFGLQAMEKSDSFSVLGLDVAVSNANWTPVIISGVISIVGIILLVVRK